MKSLFTALRNKLRAPNSFSSKTYWDERYREGGNSGPGSYGHLARFKADVLNRMVLEKSVSSVIEFGCGDGNQLALSQYPRYTGYDVSPVAVKLCKDRFAGDGSKEFFLVGDYDGRRADLTLSLDVIFHLVEDEVFHSYMDRLFDASLKHVVIYSSNLDQSQEESRHVRHREFTRWVQQERASQWELVQRIANGFPYDGDFQATSFSEFFVYQRR